MKRIMTFTGWLVMAATLFAGMTACTKENKAIDDLVPTKETPKTYTLSVEATKGDAMTRALTLEGKKLNATWTAGDVVSVQKGSDDAALTLGSLKATNVRDGGLNCTLTGELTTLPNVNDELTLKYQLGTYGTQKGTLEGIATKHDAAIATVTVATVDTEAKNITTTGVANFVNQQAIVKFSLKRPDGTTFAATNLTVKHGSKTYRVSPETPSSELFVAIPGNSATISLVATDGTDAYFYNKDGVTFTNGQYYAIGVTMKRGNVDLAAATGDVTLKKGDIAYGTLSGNYEVSIEDKAEVTLNAVNIAGTTGSDVEPSGWAGITCKGTATINIYGTNTVRAFYQYYPGILIPSGKTLTIQGDGALEVSSFSGAAIGGGCVLNPDTPINCGNIVIKGGTITAQGGDNSAGIGSGWTSSCGDITISGGTITATGGKFSAGIGTGMDGICGNISISGGIVTASGMKSSAGIGTGHRGSCGDITITDKVTSVTAYRRESTDFTIGKSIDNNNSFICGTVKIGGTTYYNGSSFKNHGETYLATSPFIYPEP